MTKQPDVPDSESQMPSNDVRRSTKFVDPDLFREALGSVATPVAIVTSHHDGRPHGTTVSAFCSLSLDPPLVLVSLDRRSDLLSMVRVAERYGINVLSHGQDELAMRFARKGEHKFEGVEWELDHGAPRLPGIASWLACRVEQLLDGGDHVIAVGVVEHAETVVVDPLLYRNSAFGTIVHR